MSTDSMNIDDLYEHPHDRGVLTHHEVVMLYETWREAGSPDTDESLMEFFEERPWLWFPPSWIARTAAEMERPRIS